MEFMNLLLMAEVMLLACINMPPFFKIPVNFNPAEYFISTKSKQLYVLFGVTIWRVIDFIMITFDDAVRLNTGSVMLAEQLTMLAISWVLWLELIDYLPDKLQSVNNHVKLQYIAFLGPLILSLSATQYQMFFYTPTSYRVVCDLITPADATETEVWFLAGLRLIFSIWIPAHVLLLVAYRQNKRQALITAGIICLLLYLPEIPTTTSTMSHNASTARFFTFIILSVFINASVKARQSAPLLTS